MKKQFSSDFFGVIGLGRFGTALVQCLAEAGKEVVAIDSNESRVKEIRKYTDNAYVVDVLDNESLEEMGIQNCDTVIVCIGEQLDISVLTTMLVVGLGVPHVIAKATSIVHGAILEKLGAVVVYPERDMAVRLGKRLISRNFLDYVSLDNNVEVRRIQAAGNLIGATVQDIDTRKKYGLNIIAIERDHRTDTDFSPQFRFESGDIISVIGRTDRIEKFESDIQAGD